jgi:2-dehydro-3-deoxyphosphogalactonate aldolase
MVTRENTSLRDWLAKCPLIAILRGIETHEIDAIFSELLAAGIVIAEIPLNSPAPIESIKRAAELFSGTMLVGAGTVTEVAQVRDAQAAGARLVVSPNADAEVVREAKQLGLIAIPGIGTATEAFSMVRAGADALKLFPADVLGTRMMTGLRAVLPKGTLMIPVGGVDEESIPAWRKAGAEGFGVGSSLYKPGDAPIQVGEKARRLVKSLRRS